MKKRTEVWNEIKHNDNGDWVGEIWVNNGYRIILFDTVIDNDKEMFHYWLDFYTNTARRCFEETTDINEVSACYLRA